MINLNEIIKPHNFINHVRYIVLIIEYDLFTSTYHLSTVSITCFCFLFQSQMQMVDKKVGTDKSLMVDDFEHKEKDQAMNSISTDNRSSTNSDSLELVCRNYKNQLLVLIC